MTNSLKKKEAELFANLPFHFAAYLLGQQQMTNVEKVRLALYAFEKGSEVTSTKISRITRLRKKACVDILWRLWKKGDIDSNEVGIYIVK